MTTLPNDLNIFNATPHVIRFWDPEWPEPVEVRSDTVVDAAIKERVVLDRRPNVKFVTIEFTATDKGREIVAQAYRDGADVVVGSIIAAQAYPGLVVAMTPAKGYERVPPGKKRMRPDKFTVYSG